MRRLLWSAPVVILLALGALPRPAGGTPLAPGDYVVTARQSVFQVDPVSGAATLISGCSAFGQATLGAGPCFQATTDVEMGRDGSIVVADQGANAVFRIDPATGDRTVISGLGIGNGIGLSSPRGVAVAPNGDIFVADYDLDLVFRVDPLTGDRSPLPNPIQRMFRTPWDVDFLPSGSILVATDTFPSVFEINPDTGASEVYSSSAFRVGGGIQLRSATYLAVASDGMVYLSSPHSVTAIDPISRDRSTVVSTTTADPDRFVHPWGIAVDLDGNVVVVDLSTSLIHTVDPESGARRALTSELTSIWGIAVVPEPSFWILSLCSWLCGWIANSNARVRC